MKRSLAHYVTLGPSGLRVSPLCLGAMTFGEEFGFGATAADSEAILRRYLELGGNFVDTANLYNFGTSERIIGDYLTKNPGARHRMVLATKFSGNLHAGNPNTGGANRKGILLACEESLRRLQTDYIDLYWQHWLDPFTPVEETMRALDDLVRAGKVRYIGFSDNPAWRVAQAQMLAELRGWTPLIALQIEYNLIERTVEGELLPVAREFGLGVTPWSPLRSGFLTGKYTRANSADVQGGRAASIKRNAKDSAFQVLDVLLAVAQQAATTPARAALAWVLQRPGVTSPIIGARTLAQLEDNLAALDVTLSDEQLERLNAASKPTLSFPFDMVQSALTQSFGGLVINGRDFAAHGWAKPDRKP